MARAIKKKKLKTIIGSGRTFDEQKMGTEPTFDGEADFHEICRALNWYSYFHEADQAKKWLIDYMKFVNYDKEEIRQVKSSVWG